jgi:hypothetical protein
MKILLYPMYSLVAMSIVFNTLSIICQVIGHETISSVSDANNIVVKEIYINDFLIYMACPSNDCNYKKVVKASTDDTKLAWRCEKCGKCFGLGGKL